MPLLPFRKHSIATFFFSLSSFRSFVRSNVKLEAKALARGSSSGCDDCTTALLRTHVKRILSLSAQNLEPS